MRKWRWIAVVEADIEDSYVGAESGVVGGVVDLELGSAEMAGYGREGDER